MFLARMRTGRVNQLALASTPEGFRYCYRTFVEQAADDKRLIRVKTVDNPYLPDGFVESLERNYPSQLIQAYLEGHFVNMASCSLYPDFDRSLNYTDADFAEVTKRFVAAAEKMKQDGWWWNDGTLTNKAIKRQILKEMVGAVVGR